MKRTIKVEQRHIDAGKRAECDKCPVALALLDTIPEADVAHVEPPNVYVELDGGGALTGNLPREAELWINDYDEQDDGYPTPFEFELDLHEVEVAGDYL